MIEHSPKILASERKERNKKNKKKRRRRRRRSHHRSARMASAGLPPKTTMRLTDTQIVGGNLPEMSGTISCTSASCMSEEEID